MTKEDLLTAFSDPDTEVVGIRFPKEFKKVAYQIIEGLKDRRTFPEFILRIAFDGLLKIIEQRPLNLEDLEKQLSDHEHRNRWDQKVLENEIIGLMNENELLNEQLAEISSFLKEKLGFESKIPTQKDPIEFEKELKDMGKGV